MSGARTFRLYRAARRVAGPHAALRLARALEPHWQGPRLPAPDPLPSVTRDADAAWLAGWWQGKVVGVALGLAAAVLLGWLR